MWVSVCEVCELASSPLVQAEQFKAPRLVLTKPGAHLGHVTHPIVSFWCVSLCVCGGGRGCVCGEGGGVERGGCVV